MPPASQATSSATNAPAANPETNSLPDLGNASQSGNASIRPGPHGVTISNTFDGKIMAVTPEYSDQTGWSIAISAGVAADTTAPVTTVAPVVANTTHTGTTLSVTINESGTGYYLVQAAAAAAPSVVAVQAGTAFAMTANVQSVAVTTTAASLPAGYVVQGGLTWTPNNLAPASIGQPGYPGSANWADANAFCTADTFNGQTGWRLPTQTELSGLYSSGAMNGQGWALNDTWSSTANGSG